MLLPLSLSMMTISARHSKAHFLCALDWDQKTSSAPVSSSVSFLNLIQPYGSIYSPLTLFLSLSFSLAATVVLGIHEWCAMFDSQQPVAEFYSKWDGIYKIQFKSYQITCISFCPF